MAAPLNYTINFTTTAGTAPTAGSFTYDDSTGLFSNFQVLWDVYTFDLTSSANTPVTGGGAPECQSATGATAFLLLSNQCGASGWAATVTSAGPFPAAIHWFSFFALPQPITPPETLSIYTTVNHSGSPRLTSGSGSWTLLAEQNDTGAVPEPASMTMVALAAAALLFRARSGNHAQS